MTGLPDGTVARMQRLAEQRTAQSHPFPALDRSIRRDRRVRFGGAAVVLAAVLAGGTFVGAAAFEGPSVAVPAGIQDLPQTPEDAGYPGKTVGSLSADRVWLDGLRQKVVSASSQGIASTEDVRVVAAGDIEDKARYALVLYPSATYPWSRELWTGPFQAEPGAMQSSGVESSEDSVPADAIALFSVAGDRVDDAENLQDPVVIVSAPKAGTVSILTSSRLEADGEYSKEWREFGPPVADGLWATSISPAEHLLAQVQADGRPTSSSSSGSSLRDQEGNELDFGPVAAPGSDPGRLRALPSAFIFSGPGALNLDEEPVYAATSQVKGFKVAVGLLRAPSGAYLTGFSTTDPDGVRADVGSGSTKIVPAGPAPDAVMAGMRTTGEKKTYGVVLAPKNAVEVRIGQFSAPVQNRIAIVEVQAARDATLPVTAVDEHGQEVGRITLPSAMP